MKSTWLHYGHQVVSSFVVELLFVEANDWIKMSSPTGVDASQYLPQCSSNNRNPLDTDRNLEVCKTYNC